MNVLPLRLWIHGLRLRKLYTSMAVRPAPVWVPTQQSLFLNFMSVVGQAENFSPCPMLPPMPMDPWAVTKKALSFSQCGSDISSSPGPYPVAACSEFHVGQARSFSPYPRVCSYTKNLLQIILLLKIVFERSQFLIISLDCKNKSVAYSFQGSHTGQLDFCN